MSLSSKQRGWNQQQTGEKEKTLFDSLTHLSIIRLAVALQPLWEDGARFAGGQVLGDKAHVFRKHRGCNEKERESFQKQLRAPLVLFFH